MFLRIKSRVVKLSINSVRYSLKELHDNKLTVDYDTKPLLPTTKLRLVRWNSQYKCECSSPFVLYVSFLTKWDQKPTELTSRPNKHDLLLTFASWF